MSGLSNWLREEAEIAESFEFPNSAAKHREAADEIERLGRCNEEINRTLSAVINLQATKIDTLKNLLQAKHHLYCIACKAIEQLRNELDQHEEKPTDG